MHYFINPLRKLFDINGKASLKEFWYFFLFTWFVLFPIWIFAKARLDLSWEWEYAIRTLFTLPLLTLGFRRLNDAGYNKWLFLVPLAGVLLATTPTESSLERAEQ